MEESFVFLLHLALLCPSYLAGCGGLRGALAHTYTPTLHLTLSAVVFSLTFGAHYCLWNSPLAPDSTLSSLVPHLLDSYFLSLL